MKCEMPDCNNDSTKKITKNGIFYGISLDDCSIHVCENHTIHEINTCLDDNLQQDCINSQMCNPFMQAEFIKKSAK